MPNKTLVAFGLGPITGGLFYDEASRSGDFSELVVAEIDRPTVGAIRANRGRYDINVASLENRTARTVTGITPLNPNDPSDARNLVAALSRADEIVTALPSVAFYSAVASQLVQGLSQNHKRVVIYTAENDNRAAEKLEQLVSPQLPNRNNVAFLNTVIGKMSQRVNDPEVISEMGLEPIAPGLGAFLVEETPQILLCRSKLPAGYETSLNIFQEKDPLLPFEHAKLYGHNAIHSWIGYMLALRSYLYMKDARRPGNEDLLSIAREAFLKESGAAFVRKYSQVDQLFTEAGYQAYADDLLLRMTNPHLNDTVERITRDPERKLGAEDRFIGLMNLALEQGIDPRLTALGVAAALHAWKPELSKGNTRETLAGIWGEKAKETAYRTMQHMIWKAHLLVSDWMDDGCPYLPPYLERKNYIVR